MSPTEHQPDQRRRCFPVSTSALLSIVLSSLVVIISVGCRQPVTNPQSAAFPRLFGGNRLAGNGTGVGGNTPAGFSNGFGSNNPFSLNANAGGNQQNPGGLATLTPQQYQQLESQFNNMQQRLSAYDNDNQLLNTELAAMKQRLELANQYGQQLKQQLADTSARMQQSEQEKQTALQQLADVRSNLDQFQKSGGQLAGFRGNQVPGQLTGSATILANNGLVQRLGDIQIPGGQARVDGDVIRIELPSDNMFVPGTYELQPAQLPALQRIVTTIRQSFPKQIVGIEAHWDRTPLNPPTISHHQYTATQALAVFDRLVSLGLPRNQLFTMAMGSNRPRHARQVEGGIHPNRRIELVIYPETYDGSSSQ